MAGSFPPGAEARQLLARACVAPLPAAQQQVVLRALASGDLTTAADDLTPAGTGTPALAGLVEHNPLLATEVVQHGLRGAWARPQRDAALAALATATMSLHSMEVVNRVSNVRLPSDREGARGSTTGMLWCLVPTARAALVAGPRVNGRGLSCYRPGTPCS